MISAWLPARASPLSTNMAASADAQRAVISAAGERL
jgi:hypothetical protein